MMDGNRNDEGNELLEWDGVQEGDACPNCFETRIDWLVWNDDGETVTCATCSAVYNPSFEGGMA
jgi:hypothetical protein